MSNSLIIIFFIFYQVNCIYNEISVPIVDVDNNITLKIGISKSFSIEFVKPTNITFDINDDYFYQINIHSINCNFYIYSNGEIINQINLDTYSLKIKNESKSIIIKPITDKIEGREKENYELQKCYLSINSFNESEPTIKVENKEETIFYFEYNDSKSLNISYILNEISDDNFASLFFQFNEKCNFSVNISYNIDNHNYLISKHISNSTYIFLSSDKLKNNYINNSTIVLNIIIKKIDINKEIKMSFKIIEKEIISMLQKNALNYGFITTKVEYQYYYLEVFEGEEGEIMLHNKRFYGELFAKIISKDELNNTDLYNTSIYPKSNDTNITFLDYNPHSLKLIYNYDNTFNCYNGCYILITYEQKQSIREYPNIGYEFTLLSRTWNYSDFITSIIDIPFNEYILGAFEKDSINHHYYSIHIPKDADKIIIQYEGNYIDIFYGEGRKKINTMKMRKNDKNLKIINNQYVLTLYNKDYNFKNKTISFAFRPKNYFTDIFSFYYFRILYAKKDEIIYFPIDSQLGNLCSPEMDYTNKYYCHFIFSNNYNELSKNFSISSFNLNNYFKINAIIVYNNGTNIEISDLLFIYYNNNNISKINYYCFTFEFENNEIKSIISTISERINNSYPHIYSAQMFYLIGIRKNFLYKIKNKYTLINKYIYGPIYYNGWIESPFLNILEIQIGRNFRGKPVALDIDSRTNNMLYGINSYSEFIFVIKLEYIMRNKGIIEIQSGETRSQIMESGNFPLYYYFKIKYPNYINFDVNLRLNSYDDSVMKNNFEIKGYLLDEDTIKRKINGEYIQLNNSINGIYSNRFKVGLIEVNQNNTIDDNYSYFLIEINNLNNTNINSSLLVELIVKENYEDVYFMLASQYIIETFDGNNNTIRDKNKYHILANQKGDDEVWIELSPEYNDIEIKFTNETNPDGFRCSDFNCTLKYMTGFKKYLIHEDKVNLYFNVINPKRRKANYMIRYFFGGENESDLYYLNKMDKEYINTNNEKITLSLTFDPIKIIYHDKPAVYNFQIEFYISGLLYKKIDSSEELINTTAILYEKSASYEDQTIHLYNLTNPEKFRLVFNNIPRKDNYIYDLQIKANVFQKQILFNEEFLIFTREIDLTDIKLKEENSILWYILGPILAIIILLLISFFIIKYIRLQKANTKLKEEMKSMAYSNDIYHNVIVRTKKDSNKESDYDSTFI